MIQLCKVGLWPRNGCPAGGGTTYADESAQSSRPVLLRTIKSSRVASLGKSARMAFRGFPIHQSRHIVEMGPHASFAVEASNCSEWSIQLLQRRFQRFSDDWLRRVMNALREWQIWASKHSPPVPFWNP